MIVPTKALLDEARELQPEIVNWRRHLHRHPELSFAEHETAGFAAARLREMGFAVRQGVASTGVVAELGSGGKMVALRADMDALPIQETNQTDYASAESGVMHACGHDAHIACLLAAAKLLCRLEELPGRIRLILQPSEENSDAEGKSGAFRMVEEGVMEGVTAVLGLHVDASLASGRVGIMSGPIMASCDGFDLTIQGRGGHGAYPESAIDSVVIAAHLVTAMQQIVSRRISALDPSVITIGSIHSSSLRGNVISESVALRGTVRSFSESVRVQLREEIERVCSLATALGGSFTLVYQHGYPVTINDEQVTAVMRAVACEQIGVENVLKLPVKTWSEDFSRLAQAAPGAFMFLGAEMSDYRRSHHTADFDLDESGLFIGPAILAATALKLLSD
jgi:amidohydrolase